MQQSESKVNIWTGIMQTSDSEFFVALGARITKRRKQLNLTQADIGSVLNVTQQQVASYEKGEKRIPLSRIPCLAECLSMDIQELVEGKVISSGKRGPSPKIQRQLEKIHKLPKSKQRFVSELLNNVLSQHSL